MRYIVRIPGGIFSHDSTESDFYDASSTIIEAQDINVNSAGLTKSKHYQGSNYGRLIPSSRLRRPQEDWRRSVHDQKQPRKGQRRSLLPLSRPSCGPDWRGFVRHLLLQHGPHRPHAYWSTRPLRPGLHRRRRPQ
ncbi:hypothetical protein CaCOL14_008980 [Colletotrichum acutatum]